MENSNLNVDVIVVCQEELTGDQHTILGLAFEVIGGIQGTVVTCIATNPLDLADAFEMINTEKQEFCMYALNNAPDHFGLEIVNKDVAKDLIAQALVFKGLLEVSD